MESRPLHVIGSAISSAFAELVSVNTLDRLSRRPLVLITEQQRFKLWAHSLGLHQQGHESLDYRLRYAVSVKEGLIEVLTDLQGHIDELVTIAQGNRGPLDEAPVLQGQDEDTESLGNESISTDSSSLRSESSFHEVDFRIRSVAERNDALFAFAEKIRNPRNRPQPSLEQLFKDIPAGQLPTYIHQREEAETRDIESIHHQYLLSNYTDYADDCAELAEWLLFRLGCGNVRRKQLFTFWKIQAQKVIPPAGKLEQLRISEEPTTDIRMGTPQVAPFSTHPATKYVGKAQTDLDHGASVSRGSQITTASTSQIESLKWPTPPRILTRGTDFVCPYCYMPCPREYRLKDAWREHLIHDLQPYQSPSVFNLIHTISKYSHRTATPLNFEATYGCQVAIIDYHNGDSLQSFLHGVDLVILRISSVRQPDIIDAARPGHLEYFSSSIHNRMNYTPFSRDMFYERFAPGGLRAYNMGATCQLSQDDRMIDVRLGREELPEADARGRPIQMTLTSAVDIVRFVAVAVKLGMHTCRGNLKYEEHVSLLSESNNFAAKLGKFDVKTIPYVEIISKANAGDYSFAMHHFLEVAEGRYTFTEANLNGLVDVEPIGFRQWLYEN
ncbi:hypothetical protein O1611_g7621 [Lasiodiplodia mahajangana]|uniref:Uncharacterized protein n=1 Tax=Lasiodiplodia mahajangana TaxID=1108764 RepID=A0ACC2JF30_9PEZI|nr:hypothetical protein O1611_g7621 [Lasiodiplodia mahajangana]